MVDNSPSDVASAFEMLLEEIEAEVDFVNGVGSRAFAARDLDKARQALARADQLTAFRDKAAALRKEWESLATLAEQEEDEATRAERRNLGRLRRGMRTSEAAYYLPILQTLADMGGSAKVAEVLERVGRLMKPSLKKVDFEPLGSDPNSPRWRNTAQWARNEMVKQGLLSAESRRGVWQITEQGRALLKRQA